MNDKQQLSAIGEHMREMEECKQKKHSYAQVMTWAGDYEKIGGHGLIVEMLKSYAESLNSSQCKPELKVPDGWKLVPYVITERMWDAMNESHCSPASWYLAAIENAPEYKP